MARETNRLSAKTAASLTKSGRHPDGGGLQLDIRAGKHGSQTGKSWVFGYRSPVHKTQRKAADGTVKLVGREREMGFGRFGLTSDAVSLAQARELAEAARKLIREGKDPLDERERPANAGPAIPTFAELADEVLESMSAGWRNAKHRDQWRMTLTEYAAPLRPVRVDEITTEHVLATLRPHWTERPETADRLRGRIERILGAASAKGYRTGLNPALWRGHLQNLLPKRAKLTRGHHAAMGYADVPAFIHQLRQREGVAALTLEFLILSAVRSGEVRGALWPEFDLTERIWTIPANRMKAGRLHRVPLTPRMLQILDIVRPLQGTDSHVFPGLKQGRPLSDMTLGAVLRRMKIEDVTTHGFRSSFRDWAGSATSFPRELAEEALAHVVGDATERAYRRSDALERRRELMNAWERHCCTDGADNVVSFVTRRPATA